MSDLICVQIEANTGRGFSKHVFFFFFFAALISLGLRRVCACPAVISGNAVETKKRLLEKCNNLWFLFNHD